MCDISHKLSITHKLAYTNNNMGFRGELSIPEAKSAVRKYSGDFGKRRRRQHAETADLKATQMRILEGELCTNCKFFHIFPCGMSPNGYPQIILNCDENSDPVTIYMNTELGKVPLCDKLRKKPQ
jgi:hypothetical protein